MVAAWKEEMCVPERRSRNKERLHKYLRYLHPRRFVAIVGRYLETFGKQCLSRPKKFYYYSYDDDAAELIKTSSWRQ